MASGTIILFPTEMEAAPLRRLRPDARIAICGVGMAACAAAVAALLPQLDCGQRLILAGIAGAYGERAAVGLSLIHI